MTNVRSNQRGARHDRTQSGPPEDCRGEATAAAKWVASFVVTGCDASPSLQAAKHALDEVALEIGNLVERMTVLAGGTVPRSMRKRCSPSMS